MPGWLRAAQVLLLLVVAGIAVAPAALLDRPIAGRTHDRVRLVDTEGPWWRGRGTLTTEDGSQRLPVAWRVAFAPLATGTLVVELLQDGDAARPSGTIRFARGGVDVQGFDLHAPAALLAGFVPALGVVAPGGEIALRAPAFAWREGGAGAGSLDAQWGRARLSIGGLPLDLGTVSLSAASAADGLAGSVRNDGGDLRVTGTLGEHAGVAELALLLTPAAGASEVVRGLLPLLGTSDGSGGVRVTWRSRR